MNKIKFLIASLVLATVVFVGCNKEEEPTRDPIPESVVLDFSEVEIQDFMWKGLNTWYLWKDDVSSLSNTTLDNEQDYYDLLNSHSDPADFYKSQLYLTESVDVFSFLTDDYTELENSFQGIIKSNGVKFQLTYETGSSSEIFGYVKYVLPNSDATGKDVKRGYVFDAIDGEQLTITNYKELINKDSYVMNFADLNGGNPIPNGKSASLTQSQYTENPIYISKTLDIDGTKIGYLMYNGFDSGFETELNDAFSQLKADGVTDLVLDLRYNGGGYGYVAKQLASAITGQFKGEVLKKDVYNSAVQQYYEDNYPEGLVDNFIDKIIDIEGAELGALTSLNLNTVYVLTTSGTASASEVVISGLKPHINVVTVGTTTYGKYTGSTTLYDSDNFRKNGDNLNPRHKWAIQPIILKYTNAIGEDVRGGIEPTVEFVDYLSKYGELGDPAEPLLAKAIEKITGVTAKSLKFVKPEDLIEFKELPSLNKFEKDLIITTKLPENFQIGQ